MWALQPRSGARGGRQRSECGAGGRPRPPTAQRIGRQDALSAELPARVRPWSETLRTRWDEKADHPFVHALTRHYAARVRIRRPGGDRRDHDGGADRDKKNPPKSAHHLPAKLATPPRHNGFSTGYLPPWNIARQGRPIPNRGALAPLRSLAGEHGANRYVRVIHQSAPATATNPISQNHSQPRLYFRSAESGGLAMAAGLSRLQPRVGIGGDPCLGCRLGSEAIDLRSSAAVLSHEDVSTLAALERANFEASFNAPSDTTTLKSNARLSPGARQTGDQRATKTIPAG